MAKELLPITYRPHHHLFPAHKPYIAVATGRAPAGADSVENASAPVTWQMRPDDFFKVFSG